METVSPHLYKRLAKTNNISAEIVERALAQSAPPIRKGLPAILTLGHLAKLTGVDYPYLRTIVKREHDGYRPFTIKKRGGGNRFIAAPEPKLAAVQRWISRNLLNHCSMHNASFAYKPKSSTLHCAEKHLGADWLIKVDIHDFFQSITERRAYFVFRDCGYQPLVSFELARICTRAITGRPNVGKSWSIKRNFKNAKEQVYDSLAMGHLPQGAPTSPMLSNLSSRELDSRLQQLADEFDLTYTRYSDDIIFSKSGQFSHKKALILVVNVERLFKSFGHELHRRKVTIAPPGARKIVLGLLVDGQVLKLPREFRNRISNHVRGIEKFGLAQHSAERHFVSIWGMIRHIQGLLVYAHHVDAGFASPLRSRLEAALMRENWRSV